jgi:RNA-binding protein YlmH
MTGENQKELQLFLAHIHEMAERALREQKPEWTDFLETSAREEAEAVLKWVNGVRYHACGGYSRSERRRLVIYPDYYIVETIEPALEFLEITGNHPSPPGHRDYLGALMSLGIKRERIGDILAGPAGGQVVVVPELSDFIRTSLTEVASRRVKVAAIEPEQLNLPDQREKVIRSTVASLRLDAVAALGFGDSRTKMTREIKSERVKVNWKIVKSPDLEVAPGTVISIRGRGRVEFREVTGNSKKGRIGIVLARML